MRGGSREGRPPKEWLTDRRAEGLTYAQIAERWYDETGHRRTPSAMIMAARDYGIPRVQLRYDDLVPWRVRPEHNSHYALRMLRAESRRRRGLKLSAEDAQRLDAYLAQLAEANAVIAYDPESPEGFVAVPRLDEDDLIVPPGPGTRRKG